MNNNFDQEVGTVEAQDTRKYVYHAGQDSFGNTYYKSMSTFAMGFLEDLRKACYIPALFPWRRKDGEKFYTDETIYKKPELIYTVGDIYDMCGQNLAVAFVVLSLLRGQIPERFIAYLLRMKVLDYYPSVYRCPYHYLDCCDADNEKLYEPSAYFKIVNNVAPDPLTDDPLVRKADFGNNYYYFHQDKGKWNLSNAHIWNTNPDCWYYISETHFGAKVTACRYARSSGNLIDSNLEGIHSNFRACYRENNSRVTADQLRYSGAKPYTEVE